MERKKFFRRAKKPKAQFKRRGAEEFAEEFPEGPLGAPPQVSNHDRTEHIQDNKKKE